jgi:hypothetical protein
MQQDLNSVKTCADVTLWEYLRCYFRKEYDLVGGEAAWNDILEEYCKLLEDGNYSQLIEIYREMIRMNATYQVITDCLFILNIRRDEQAIEYLRRLGYDYQFPKDDRDAYRASLSMIEKKSKTLIIQLKSKEAEYERITKENGKPQTENDFIAGVMIVSKFFGFKIDLKGTTLIEYSQMQKHYNMFYEKKINAN